MVTWFNSPSVLCRLSRCQRTQQWWLSEMSYILTISPNISPQLLGHCQHLMVTPCSSTQEFGHSVVVRGLRGPTSVGIFPAHLDHLEVWAANHNRRLHVIIILVHRRPVLSYSLHPGARGSRVWVGGVSPTDCTVHHTHQGWLKSTVIPVYMFNFYHGKRTRSGMMCFLTSSSNNWTKENWFELKLPFWECRKI